MAEAGAHDSAAGVKILHIGWRGWSSLSLGPDRAGPYHDQVLPPDREDRAFPQHVRAEFRRMKICQEMREFAPRRNQDSEGFIAATPTVRPERVEGQIVQSDGGSASLASGSTGSARTEMPEAATPPQPRSP